MESKRHLSQSEVANRFGMCIGTLERWRRQGTGPRFLKLHTKVLYRLEDVEAYEQECLRISTSEKASAGGNA